GAVALDFYVLPELHANDVLHGGAGADLLIGDGGSDTLYGGDDDDQLVGDSALLAAEHHRDDYLDGGDGSDRLWGGGGDDTLFGGDGDDALQGDASEVPPELKGADYLDGGNGVDTLTGDGGDDVLYGGDGADFLFGDADNLPADADGVDLLDGEDGDDYLRGHGGDDVLFGGAGDDQLLGDGDGSRDGEAGDDYLVGGTGTDLMDGGAGDDTYEINVGDGVDKIFDRNGINTVVFGPGIAASSITIDQGSDSNGAFLVIGYGNGDLLAIANGFTGGIHRYQFADGTVLTPEELSRRLPQQQYLPVYADPLDGAAISTGLSEVLSGTAGDNTYRVDPGNGRDLVIDPGGIDTVRFGPPISAADLRFSRQSNGDLRIAMPGGEVRIERHFVDVARRVERFELDDGTVIGAAALDALPVEVIEGSDGDDRMTGSDFDDALAGRAGRDELSGGRGADTYVFSVGDGHDVVVDGDPAAEGSDRLQLRGFTRDDLLIERDVAGTLTLYSLISDDRVTLPGFYLSAADRVEAIEFFADPAGNALVDTIALAELEALPTAPVAGTAGADVLNGSSADDTLYGAAGADALTGLDGADALRGEDGDDLLDAGPGADFLDGGSGNDTLTGGAGDDLYLFGYGDGQDTIADGAAGDADALALFAGAGPADVELERLANDLVVKLRNALDQVTVRDQFAGDGIDRIDFADGTLWDRIEIAARLPNRLTDGPDTFTGSAYADTVFGGGGDDQLYGQRGDDLVDGGDGADQLYGGDGDDRLHGKAGADWLSAGSGADALEGGAGADMLLGEDGADALAGGAGDDTLRGGAGSDTYRFAPGDGRDTIDDYDASANRVDVLAFWASDSTRVALRREWSIYDSNDDLHFDLLDAAGQPTGEGIKLWRPFFADDAYRMVDRVEFA
ncbi:MAG: hypothetical protein IT519_17325, partial [Burkholderiales bacterium]|nr:hypothetical protein [Burkholderiales bacterium]